MNILDDSGVQSSKSGEAHAAGRWQFWIDRGGTFTDIVGKTPDETLVTCKLLSEDPSHYDDAAIEGMRRLLGFELNRTITSEHVELVKMGTTVATNALLEHKGERTALFVTKGLKDFLEIGYQNRPRLFDLNVVLPQPLYHKVYEVDERVDVHGKVIRPLDSDSLRSQLQIAYNEGFRSLAVVLMHSYRYPTHEIEFERMAAEFDFEQISVSHKVVPLIKIIFRGDTTVIDAYLSQRLRQYVNQVSTKLPNVPVFFMQSNGGLAGPTSFQVRDAILSGPAGGTVGMVRTAQAAGFEKIIGFDMGGTSTDVSHFAGELERKLETEIAGLRIRVPMLSIHTVAAGGGSILRFDNGRFRVGPDSAGANPGPASYRGNGPLTITDCNVLTGKLQPAYFPQVFGPSGDEPLDVSVVESMFKLLAEDVAAATGGQRSPEEIAEGFIAVAVRDMANAIKQITVARGFDVADYVLNTFGGAGGQHACQIADLLGVKRVFVHSMAGVLSAYGIGLSDITVMRERTVELELSASTLEMLDSVFSEAESDARFELKLQGVPSSHVQIVRTLYLRYRGTDTALSLSFDVDESVEAIVESFECLYQQRYSFLIPGRSVIVENIAVQVISKVQAKFENKLPAGIRDLPLVPTDTVRMFSSGKWREAQLFKYESLRTNDVIEGPSIIIDDNSTIVIEPEWCAEVTIMGDIIMKRLESQTRFTSFGTDVDPIRLEIFNNLFSSIADQMGLRLQQTAHSVNIKERLDFSCAIFDAAGNLVANAPHIPVHLGSMGESVKAVIREYTGQIRPGDVFAINDPYQGGTHLPDITVVSPVFGQAAETIEFYVCSRGHHADVGGITPGSMPPNSTSIHEEGVLFSNWKLVEAGVMRESETLDMLTSGPNPARNPDQNLADLRAQVAANVKGEQELDRMIEEFGLDVTRAYTQHVQDNAEEAIRRLIGDLSEGKFRLEMDGGAIINVQIQLDKVKRSAVIDFTGTSAQLNSNFNAPSSITHAVVLFVLRSLIKDNIPLNSGCLRPIEIIIPEGSMLNPKFPAAVVAGNVETSQCVANALFGAFDVSASSQCTMNCFSFGNDNYQYIETIAGGAGATPGNNGADAVHTNMTNSLITDPEILEIRYPVLLERFEIRRRSGGDGRWKGGNGAIREIQAREAMTASILSNNRKIAPFGMAGGLPGMVGRNWIRRADGNIHELESCATEELAPGKW